MTIESSHRSFADQLFPANSMDGESNASGASGRRKRIGLLRSDKARPGNNRTESSDEDVGGLTRPHMRGEIDGNSPNHSIRKPLKRQWNRAEGSDADESVSISRKKQRLTEVGSHPDENLGIFPKKEMRETEEGNNVESFSVSLKKQKRRTEDGNGPEESVTSHLDIRSRRIEEEIRDEVTSLSLKRQRRRIDEENDPDESSSISLKKRRKKAEDNVCPEDFISSPLETARKYRVGTSQGHRNSDSSMFNGEDNNHASSSSASLIKLKGKKGKRNVEVEKMNDSFKVGMVKIEEDDVQSGDKELDTSARAGNESAFEDFGTVPVKSEEEEGIPDVGFRDVGFHKVKKKKKKKVVEYDVDMSSADGVWASSLEGPHLDLMVSLKQLAEVRLKSSGEESLANCLTPTALRAIGVCLETETGCKQRQPSCLDRFLGMALERRLPLIHAVVFCIKCVEILVPWVLRNHKNPLQNMVTYLLP